MHPDHEIIHRYLGQPERLPSDLRSRIERAWGNQPVQLYALADLMGLCRAEPPLPIQPLPPEVVAEIARTVRRLSLS